MRGQFLIEPVVSSSSQPLNRKLQQQKVAHNAVGLDRKSKSSREHVELHCLLGAWFWERKRVWAGIILTLVFRR